ncbi:unnamed protein product [Adineta steineri]|uniref:Uncharacterized protein n=1 Tax=Adineta steineri TaxID=433720 RepID=A0A814ZDL0_9BILA|nr:unnamed protein product [Adineta steineri]CAF1285373.1 unnamed protein product [Adineta steineri]
MHCILIGSQNKCLCRHKFSEHKTDFAEIPTERPILISCQQHGHSTGYATPYKAMGDLTGFSSLAEGYLRLDPGGPDQSEKDILL